MNKKPATLNLTIEFEKDSRGLAIVSGGYFEAIVPGAGYWRHISKTPRKDGVIFPIGILDGDEHLYRLEARNFKRLMICWMDPFGPEISTKVVDLWITLEEEQPGGACRIGFSPTRQEDGGLLSILFDPESSDLWLVTPQDFGDRKEKLEVDRDCHLILSGTHSELYSLVIRRLGEKRYLFQITPTHIGR